MKTNQNSISKSKVMKRAWAIKRGQFTSNWSFSECLIRAWYVEKEIIRKEEEAKRLAEPINVPVRSSQEIFGRRYIDMSSPAAFYASAPRGYNFGD